MSWSPSCKTIKIHRTTADTAPTQDAWTDCDNFTVFADETNGGVITLNVDGKTLNILRDGIYIFGGCIHFQNNSGGDKTPLVASRLYQNGTTEMRCSQRAWKGTQKAGGEDTLAYSGTAKLSAGDTVTLQYYTDDNSIDFDSNAVFDNEIAYTLWLVRCGD